MSSSKANDKKIVLQKWLKQWYMGHVIEETATQYKIHLRGYPPESDKWFTKTSSSIKLQQIVGTPSAIGCFPKEHQFVSVHIADEAIFGTIAHHNLTLVGSIIKVVPDKDSAIVDIVLPGDRNWNGEQRTQISNSYIQNISKDEFIKLLDCLQSVGFE